MRREWLQTKSTPHFDLTAGGRTLAVANGAVQLTNREQSVVENLAKGWTNKEIANALHITEQTVKEHIKHIMRKTNSTTRTGVLVQVFRS